MANDLTVIFALLGSERLNAACKKLVKSTPGAAFDHSCTNPYPWVKTG